MRVATVGPTAVRMVTHLDVSDEDAETAAAVVLWRPGLARQVVGIRCRGDVGVDVVVLPAADGRVGAVDDRFVEQARQPELTARASHRPRR